MPSYTVNLLVDRLFHCFLTEPWTVQLCHELVECDPYFERSLTYSIYTK